MSDDPGARRAARGTRLGSRRRPAGGPATSRGGPSSVRPAGDAVRVRPDAAADRTVAPRDRARACDRRGPRRARGLRGARRREPRRQERRALARARRQGCSGRTEGERGADQTRARGARSARRGPFQPRDRRAALREPQDRAAPRRPHSLQAQGAKPRRVRRRGGARPGSRIRPEIGQLTDARAASPWEPGGDARARAARAIQGDPNHDSPGARARNQEESHGNTGGSEARAAQRHRPGSAPRDGRGDPRRAGGGRAAGERGAATVILDFLDDINWAAVGVSLVAAFAIGLVWFSPSALGGFWARQVSRYTGIPEGEVIKGSSQAPPLAQWLLGFAITAVVMALAGEAVGADSAGDGVVLGLVLGVGLGATLSSWPPIFARMPWAWWLVNNGAFLLILASMGAILGAWP